MNPDYRRGVLALRDQLCSELQRSHQGLAAYHVRIVAEQVLEDDDESVFPGAAEMVMADGGGETVKVRIAR